MTRRCPIDVFHYLDYRSFLSDFYQARKKRGYSYRVFARRAGFSSPNYLKLVIEGKRNLSLKTAKQFAEACDLRGEAADYFQILVAFNQAKSVDARNQYYLQLSAFKRYRSTQKLEMAHAAYCSKWYLPAIRELAARTDFTDDPTWIAQQLIPVPRENVIRSEIIQLFRMRYDPRMTTFLGIIAAFFRAIFCRQTGASPCRFTATAWSLSPQRKTASET